MKFQVIREGEIQAVEPVVQGEPLGLSDYAGREEILTEMVKVLTLAVGYAKEPSEEAETALLKAAKVLRRVEIDMLSEDEGQ